MTLESVLVGAVFVAAGAALCWVAWLGSQRRLPRNRVTGIRTGATLEGDETWAAAHEAAAGPLGLGGAISAAGGIAVLAAGVDDVIGTTLVIVTLAGTLVALFVAGRTARRVARSHRPPDGP